jgi:Dolichyl-phosphate-mannose-protein mannosyltransferase
MTLKSFKIPALLLLLIALHLTIRHYTFWLPHYRGDQVQYTALAMKLEHSGLKGFNLRNVDIYFTDQTKNINAIMPSQNETGVLLEQLKNSGVGYYDIPLFHKPPALPIAILLSKKILGFPDNYLLVRYNLGKNVLTIKPSQYVLAQCYAVIVPLFFSLLLMCFTFLLGRILFSTRTGLYAAFMIAVNPISILTSYKIWTDDMVSAFVILSVLLYIISRKRNIAWLSLSSGLACGIAFLGKQSGGFILPAIVLYTFWVNRHFIIKDRKWSLFFFDRYLLCFFLGSAVLIAPWLYRVYTVYGDPLFLPVAKNMTEIDKTGWWKILNARPEPLILFTIGITYLSPAFVFCYVSLKKLIKGLLKTAKMTTVSEDNVILLWLWILTFAGIFIVKGGGKEHRRMLPVYPAIAILAAYMLDLLRGYLKDKTHYRLLPEMIIISILLFSAFWSVPIGLDAVFRNEALILKPF